MAQQKPPMKPVANIISIFLANTVTNHDAENGMEVINKTFRRPNFIAMPPNIPPKRAPRSDKLATQDACWEFIVKILVKLPVYIANCCFSWREAIAGEL